MPRYKLTIEYAGDRFSGWQRQQGFASVQGTIEEAIKALFYEDVLVEGAGRTDAGVHALGQVAHVDLARPLSENRVCDALNSQVRHLGVAVLRAEIVPPTFHARFSAIERVYEYHIFNRRAPLALKAHYAWHVIHPLDIEKMQTAAHCLLGQHDFTSFRAIQCQASSPIRMLNAFEFTQETLETGTYIKARIASRSFLHNQVRIMMGTLKLVGQGRLYIKDIPFILEACDRRKSGPTAPPQGLYLKKVVYEKSS